MDTKSERERPVERSELWEKCFLTACRGLIAGQRQYKPKALIAAAAEMAGQMAAECQRDRKFEVERVEGPHGFTD